MSWPVTFTEPAMRDNPVTPRLQPWVVSQQSLRSPFSPQNPLAKQLSSDRKATRALLMDISTVLQSPILVADSQKAPAHSIASAHQTPERQTSVSYSQSHPSRSPSFKDTPRLEPPLASGGPPSPRNLSQQNSVLQSWRNSGIPESFPRTLSVRRTASSPRLSAKLDSLPDQRAFILQHDYVNPQAVSHFKQKWSRGDAGRGATAPSERLQAYVADILARMDAWEEMETRGHAQFQHHLRQRLQSAAEY